jgi:hypothetical protein
MFIIAPKALELVYWCMQYKQFYVISKRIKLAIKPTSVSAGENFNISRS